MNHDFEDFARRSCAGMAPLRTILLGMAGLLMIGCGVNNAPSNGSNAGAAPTPQPSHSGHAKVSPTRRVPAYFSNVEDAKPFPAVLDSKQFSDPSIVKAYRYAQEIPEVFSQQPCYCYCDGGGVNEKPHRSLLDCFATNHGVSCQLCLQEGLLVHKLHKEGKSASEIRDSIMRDEWKRIKLE